MIEITGNNGIIAKIICDSISESGVRLTTMLVDYPRIVHAEQLKHRMFSTSAASSRAIPFAKMSEQLTGHPVRFGQSQAGMQDRLEDFNEPVFVHRAMVESFRYWLQLLPPEQHKTRFSEEDNGYYTTPENWWKFSSWLANGCSQMYYEAGYHKQAYNRLTEPYQMMRVLITATEWKNFFYLRNDVAADPTLQEAARVMEIAYNESVPQVLKAGDYHLPFVDQVRMSDGSQEFFAVVPDDTISLTVNEAIIISCARCAAQSFRNTDYDLAKSISVYDRLINGDKIHAGALEHVATPMESYGNGNWRDAETNFPRIPNSWQHGISHADRDGNLWSGNFKGWIQHRKTINGENYNGL